MLASMKCLYLMLPCCGFGANGAAGRGWFHQGPPAGTGADIAFEVVALSPTMCGGSVAFTSVAFKVWLSKCGFKKCGACEKSVAFKVWGL